jgi:hypothetical protein
LRFFNICVAIALKFILAGLQSFVSALSKFFSLFLTALPSKNWGRVGTATIDEENLNQSQHGWRKHTQ